MKKTEIKAVLFDLGKVILFFNFEPAFAKLAKASGRPEKDIEDYFVSSGLEVLYDGGKISSRRFYLEAKKALGFRLSLRAFKPIWNQIFTPNPPVIRLIRRLKKGGMRLVLVSNTNAMHYAYVVKKYPILDLFDRHLLSFREKKRKPDTGIYRAAAKACRAKPAEIFYIDDRADLTEAAADLGFHAFTYKSNTRALESEMKKRGILP